MKRRDWGVPFVDVTPDMPTQPRRNEVLAWLKEHPVWSVTPLSTMKMTN